MSGHSHWAGIKHKKEITDKKRGKVFSKLAKLISAAAKEEPDPNFNPRLRTAIAKAREEGVTQDTIDRAVKRASDSDASLEELLFEAYGPAGSAILIEALSDSKNRTVQEIKLILKENGGKWAEGGSVQWAFEKKTGDDAGWISKFPQDVSPADAASIQNLLDALDENDDVQNVFTNTKI